MGALNPGHPRHPWRHLCLCAAACAAAGSAGLARSQEPEPPPATYTAALQAMGQHNWPQAEAQLRKTVAQHPHLAGAWLDLALALAHQGQWAEADELLANLAERFAPLPPALQPTVDYLRQQLAQALANPGPTPASTPPPTRHTLLAGWGYDSNANAGLRPDAIVLTLPGGNATLPLSPASRAQGAWAAHALYQHQTTQPNPQPGTQPYSWGVSLQARQYAGLPNVGTLEAKTRLQTAWPGSHTAHIGASAHLVWVGGQMAYQAPGLYWQTPAPWLATLAGPTCAGQQQVQYEWRRYPRSPTLASHDLAYRLQLDCQPGQPQAWQAQAELGVAQARAGQRTGGRTTQLQLQWGRSWALPWPGHRLALALQTRWAQDSAGYSPWLANGAARHLHHTEAVAQWHLPTGTAAATGWQHALQWQGHRQRSNLALFQLQGQAVQYLAWRQWD